LGVLDSQRILTKRRHPLTFPSSNMISSSLSFPITFFLLGVERLLFGYFYLFTDHFKTLIRNGFFGKQMQSEPLYWKCAMTLGIYAKVIHLLVILEDLRRISSSKYSFMLRFDGETMNIDKIAVFGMMLFFLGQALNIGVFAILGRVGVYFGNEFGYRTPRMSKFPYNSFIKHPQYVGIVGSVWRLYFMVRSNSHLIPWSTCFWYMMSIHILEHPRGIRLFDIYEKKKRKRKSRREE